jgi:hypothetical protein
VIEHFLQSFKPLPLPSTYNISESSSQSLSLRVCSEFICLSSQIPSLCPGFGGGGAGGSIGRRGGGAGRQSQPASL